jgi:hypothetical protein
LLIPMTDSQILSFLVTITTLTPPATDVHAE